MAVFTGPLFSFLYNLPSCTFLKSSQFQTLPESSVAQSTSRFPWFLDQNDVPGEKRLIAQKPRLKRTIFLSCKGQQLILHTPDLENTRERCVKINVSLGYRWFSIGVNIYKRLFIPFHFKTLRN